MESTQVVRSIDRFLPMDIGEADLVYFDFTDDLGSDTLANPVVTATVYSGTDGTPSDIVVGSASILDAYIVQLIDAREGVLFTEYLLQCTVEAGSRVLVAKGILGLVKLGQS